MTRVKKWIPSYNGKVKNGFWRKFAQKKEFLKSFDLEISKA